MAETWELICHHTYQGIPGVVVDTAPSRASYGQAIGLANGDFLTDGVTPGSGAVRVFGNGTVYVPTNAPAWQSVIGIKGEVTLRRIGQSLSENIDAFLIDSDSFKFHISQGDLVAWFSSSRPSIPRSMRGRLPALRPSQPTLRSASGSLWGSCTTALQPWSFPSMVKWWRSAAGAMRPSTHRARAV